MTAQSLTDAERTEIDSLLRLLEERVGNWDAAPAQGHIAMAVIQDAYESGDLDLMRCYGTLASRHITPSMIRHTARGLRARREPVAGVLTAEHVEIFKRIYFAMHRQGIEPNRSDTEDETFFAMLSLVMGDPARSEEIRSLIDARGITDAEQMAALLRRIDETGTPVLREGTL